MIICFENIRNECKLTSFCWQSIYQRAQEPSEPLSQLDIRTSFSKIWLLGDIFFREYKK